MTVFSSLFHYIGAQAFNTLLLRKDLCSSRRGMQIQYNVSQIEQWAGESNFSEAAMHLLMVSQAAKLLQVKFVEKSDIDFIFDFWFVASFGGGPCHRGCLTEFSPRLSSFLLNPTQIQKILSMYRDDDTEKGIPHILLGEHFFIIFIFFLDPFRAVG